MKAFRKFGLLLIGCLIFQLAYSQENYTPGYVIKNDTDTLFGFVDYRNWEKNPDKIKFKTNIGDKPISFNPLDITEFKVDGEIYVSGIINTEISSTQTAKLKNNYKENLKVDTIFLQTLIKGSKSLFYYKNAEGRENFYIKQDTGFDLLIYKRYLKIQDGKSTIAENNKYLRQLTSYLNECPNINSKLENTLYKSKSLMKLFKYYYECSASDIYFQKEIEKIRSEIGVLAGASSTILEFKSSTNILPELIYTNYNPSVNPSIGLYFDFILPRNQGKWSIYNEILFTTYKVEGSYTEYESADRYTISTTEIGYSYLNINNFIRFSYPVGQSHIFINMGISNGFSTSYSNNKLIESKFYSTNTIEHELALEATRNYEQGYILGTGIKYNRLSMQLRFEKGNGMSNYNALSSTTKSYSLLLGFRF